MTRRAFLAIGALLLAAGALFSAGPSLAAEAPEDIVVEPAKEAWHNIAQPCLALVDCSLLPSPGPFPDDTLHVALSGGEETARTYLAFSPGLPTGAVLVEGTLKLPLDTDPSHGTLNPELANFVACLTDPDFEEARGSVEKPPEVDCETRKSALYSEKQMLFEVDLGRFVEEWTPEEFALALLPSERALESTDSWRVVFPASDDDDAAEPSPSPGQTKEPPAITATLSYTIEETSAEPIGTDFDLEPPPDTGGSATGSASGDLGSSSDLSFDGSTDGGTLEPSSDLTEATTPTEAADSAPTQPVATFAAGFAGPGFAYPVVWALPLLLITIFFAVGRALTKELYRPGD